MSEIRTYPTAEAVADAAAENAIEVLRLAIELRDSASWVLAGGTSPLLAYKKIAAGYGDAIDWAKVTVVIGDERMVPHEHKDSNWGAVLKIFEADELLSQVKRIVPTIGETVESSATAYDEAIRQAGIDRFDLVWLGVGEDGHTLSLFPGNAAFTEPTEKWVIPVKDSPKPPAERFSLSLKALEHVHELVIFAVGAAKRDILREARLKGKLPVAIAAEAVETNGGEVRWLYDDAAWGEK
ncbi:MAG: 6-phosphogluconolactonase [Candidatus Microsaccharimonas sp.]